MGRTGGKLTRIKRFLGIWAKLTWLRTIAPARDPTAILQLLAYPIFLWLVFLARGFGGVSEEAVISWAAARAIAWTIPVFVAVNLVTSLFSVRREERKIGAWFGSQFVYHQPVLVATIRVTNADNGAEHPFILKEAEAGGSALLSVEIGGFERIRLRAVVYPEIFDGKGKRFSPPWHMYEIGGYRSLSMVPKNKKFYIAAECETSNWSIVKVYMESWDIK